VSTLINFPFPHILGTISISSTEYKPDVFTSPMRASANSAYSGIQLGSPFFKEEKILFVVRL
jgi:hypothetical protein